MATLALATASDILKEDYKPLTEQLNQSFFILQQIEKNTEDIEGRRAFHPIHVSRNSGVGARAENGTLPTAGSQGYTHTNIPVRYLYGRIQVSGPVIAAMKSDKGSFIRAIKSEMDGVTKDLKRDTNRQIWGTSNGVIATCGVTSAANVVVLAATTTQTQMRQLGADGSSLVVDIGTVATPTSIASARTVSAVDTVNLTITISGAVVTTTAAAFVFRAGAGGATDNTGIPGDGQLELTGLSTIVGSTAYLHTVTSATYPQWAAGLDSNSGVNRALSEPLVNKAIMARDVASESHVDLLVANAGVSRAAANLQQSIRRNVDKVDLKAGYKGLEWSAPLEGMGTGSNTVALVFEKDCPENSLFGISTDSLVQYEMSDWDWMDSDGAVLSRVSGQDAYEATLYKYTELACSQRNANFKISDITEV